MKVHVSFAYTHTFLGEMSITILYISKHHDFQKD